MSFTQKSLKTNSLIFTVGFAAIIGQLVFVRLTVQSFNGNELTMCIAIGHWLLWTGVGSLIGSRIVSDRSITKCLFVFIVLYALLLILAAILLVLIRQIIGVNISEMLGLGRIFIWTGLIFMLPSFMNGLFFPFLVNWVAEHRIGYPVHKVYITETIGSAIGGLVFIILILFGLSSINILYLITFYLIVVAGLVFIEKPICTLSIVIISGFLYGVLVKFVVPEIMTFKWSPYRINEILESPHQALTALSYDENEILFSNNEPLWGFGITENAEELVHFGMVNHSSPHRVLVIGPVFQDIIAQLEKYSSVETITSVQNDKVLDGMLEKYTCQNAAGTIEIRRIINDPLKFLRQSTPCYDVVILNVPLPVNAMWNVYYTREFFSLLKNHLDDEALVSMQFPGSETFLNDDQLSFLKVMENTAHSIFNYIAWIPGETVHLLASDQPIKINYEAITFELKYREIDNRFIRDSYLCDRLSLMKIDFLKNRLSKCFTKRINSITNPIGFYYNTVLWDRQAGGVLKNIYSWFAKTSPVFFGVILTGLFLILFVLLYRRERHAAISKLTMASVGFSIMSLESVVLIIMQSYAGALYLRVAILSMAFMIGAASGAAWQRQHHNTMNHRQLLSVLSGLLVIVLIYGLLIVRGSGLLAYAGLHYPVLFISGFTGGVIFPILSQRVSKVHSISAASASGAIYAWDIIGSCLGVYVTSGLIIPVYGLFPALWLLGIIVCLILFIQILFNK
ncbi:MAG: hypothetical protein JXR87_07245 [Candidatus Marinimicrobia bacterium]|nr:hypothetical protein [Candidatus Neomarinimicrobiota bacterium]